MLVPLHRLCEATGYEDCSSKMGLVSVGIKHFDECLWADAADAEHGDVPGRGVYHLVRDRFRHRSPTGQLSTLRSRLFLANLLWHAWDSRVCGPHEAVWSRPCSSANYGRRPVAGGSNRLSFVRVAELRCDAPSSRLRRHRHPGRHDPRVSAARRFHLDRRPRDRPHADRTCPRTRHTSDFGADTFFSGSPLRGLREIHSQHRNGRRLDRYRGERRNAARLRR